MSKGYLVFAQNSKVDYLRQAIALSASLKANGNFEPVSVVTNDPVPDDYRFLFDRVISIPWGDNSKHSEWKVENRWKLYHISPYDETIVFDSDVLVTENLTNAWNFLLSYDLFFVSTVFDFKARPIIDTVHRKAFVENNLPNIYFGFHYFKKSDLANSFYQLLEEIVKNYQMYYSVFAKNSQQEFVSMDLSSSIAVKILGIENHVTCPVVEPARFIHMKPALQSFSTEISDWSKVLSIDYNESLIVGNHVQRGVFHYVDDNFLSIEIFNNLCQQKVNLEQ